jgi:hypothetical protein
MITIHLSTTEDHVWITLPFRVRARGLPKPKARREAVRWRERGYLARVRRDSAGGWLVATYRPRRAAPRPCDLVY